MMRSPSALPWLISERAVYSPEQLYAKLGPESVLVLYQHNPPFWHPPGNVKTPMLWLAGEQDAVIGKTISGARPRTNDAEYYVAKEQVII